MLAGMGDKVVEPLLACHIESIEGSSQQKEVGET